AISSSFRPSTGRRLAVVVLPAVLPLFLAPTSGGEEEAPDRIAGHDEKDHGPDILLVDPFEDAPAARYHDDEDAHPERAQPVMVHVEQPHLVSFRASEASIPRRSRPRTFPAIRALAN